MEFGDFSFGEAEVPALVRPFSAASYHRWLGMVDGDEDKQSVASAPIAFGRLHSPRLSPSQQENRSTTFSLQDHFGLTPKSCNDVSSNDGSRMQGSLHSIQADNVDMVSFTQGYCGNDNIEYLSPRADPNAHSRIMAVSISPRNTPRGQRCNSGRIDIPNPARLMCIPVSAMSSEAPSPVSIMEPAKRFEEFERQISPRHVVSPKDNGQGYQVSPRQLSPRERLDRYVSPRRNVSACRFAGSGIGLRGCASMSSTTFNILSNQSKDSSHTRSSDSMSLNAFDEEESLSMTSPSNSSEFTTLMLRHLPNKYTRDMMLEELEARNVIRDINFFYMPIDLRHRCNVGYCFVNVTSKEAVARFRAAFHGTRLGQVRTNKTCEVEFGKVQGLDANIEHYRNNAVMYMNDKYRPTLLENGELIAFPAPTMTRDEMRTLKPKKQKGVSKRNHVGPKYPANHTTITTTSVILTAF